MKDDELLCAIIAWDRSSYLSIEDDFEVLELEPQLQYRSPEQVFIRKEMLENLSSDSKMMIKFLCDTPDDIYNCVALKNGKISKERFFIFLRAIGWKRSKIAKCFREIAEFCKYYT